MHNCIGCICMTFPQCVFPDELSNSQTWLLHNHTGCNCRAFLQCAFSNGFSNYQPERMQTHIGCICLTWCYFPHSWGSFQRNHLYSKFGPSSIYDCGLVLCTLLLQNWREATLILTLRAKMERESCVVVFLKYGMEYTITPYLAWRKTLCCLGLASYLSGPFKKTRTSL